MKYTYGNTVRLRYIFQSIPIIFSRKNKDKNYVTDYENKFKKFIGVKYAIATSSARFAIYLVLKLFKIEKGETEIILPAFLPQVIVAVIIKCGLKPVFVDIDPHTLNIDANKIEEKITKNTKFILIVHLHGIPCDLKKIKKIANKNDLFLIEDCAQAFNTSYYGKKVGSFGDVSIFSTNNYKNFNTCGGGIILTNNKKLNDKLRNEIQNLPYPNIWRNLKISCNGIIHSFFGIPTIQKYFSHPILKLLKYLKILNKKDIEKIILKGLNFADTETILDSKSFLIKYGIKFTSFQAKIGLLQFSDNRYWDELNKQNDNFNSFYKKLKLPAFFTKQMNPSYFLCFVITENAEEIVERLSKEKVFTSNHCYQDVNTLKFLKNNRAYCPVAQKTIKSIIYFPFRHHLNKSDMQIIAEKFKKINPKIIQPK